MRYDSSSWSLVTNFNLLKASNEHHISLCTTINKALPSLFVTIYLYALTIDDFSEDSFMDFSRTERLFGSTLLYGYEFSPFFLLQTLIIVSYEWDTLGIMMMIMMQLPLKHNTFFFFWIFILRTRWKNLPLKCTLFWVRRTKFQSILVGKLGLFILSLFLSLWFIFQSQFTSIT